MNKWISVEDKLPKNGDYSVLVVFNNNSVEDMKMVHVQDWIKGRYGTRITHWMPLPDPPGDSI